MRFPSEERFERTAEGFLPGVALRVLKLARCGRLPPQAVVESGRSGLDAAASTTASRVGRFYARGGG